MTSTESVRHTLGRNYIIGVDFDNTVVSYDGVMHTIASQRGLIRPNVGKTKKEIRDNIRLLPNGEIEWQKLQGLVYGPMIHKASLIEGVVPFLELCKRLSSPVYIVSHKTEYAGYDETGTNLRLAAVDWMRRHRLFAPRELGLSQDHVYFESTRGAKIERIQRLGCTHFIDDLEETFLEDSFPANVEKILYAPHLQSQVPEGVRKFHSWMDINAYFLKVIG